MRYTIFGNQVKYVSKLTAVPSIIRLKAFLFGESGIWGLKHKSPALHESIFQCMGYLRQNVCRLDIFCRSTLSVGFFVQKNVAPSQLTVASCYITLSVPCGSFEPNVFSLNRAIRTFDQDPFQVKFYCLSLDT